MNVIYVQVKYLILAIVDFLFSISVIYLIYKADVFAVVIHTLLFCHCFD